jgi:hypothetical protein
MEIGDRQQVGLPIGEPLGACEGLALWTVPIAAGNGQHPLAALWQIQ